MRSPGALALLLVVGMSTVTLGDRRAGAVPAADSDEIFDAEIESDSDSDSTLRTDADADADPDADADADADADSHTDAGSIGSTRATTPHGTAASAKPVAAAESARPWSLSGYVQPAMSLVHRPTAVPRDRWRYGAEATRAGLRIEGAPVSRWRYQLELVVAGDSNDLVTSVEVVDLDGDGVPDGVAENQQAIPGVFIERAVVAFDAPYGLQLLAGQMRVPFTAQEQSPSTALMFPGRSAPNEAFVQGPDLGALVTYGSGAGDLGRSGRAATFVAQAGAFNGTGEAVEIGDNHGLVYAVRVDVSPVGELPSGEGDTAVGPLRIGVGAGLLYYPSQNYDDAGFPGARMRDLRASASMRLAWQGLYFQSEVLRRQRTDSLSARPEITTGVYGQASWFLRGAIGFAPLVRIGHAAEDQGFAPRSTLWIEGGLALYPNRVDPSAVRILVEYLGERRLTEGENAHGAVAQLQLVW